MSANLDLGTLTAHIKVDGADETQKDLNKLGDSFSDLGDKFGIHLPSGLQDSLNDVGGSITDIYTKVKNNLPDGLQKGLEGLDSAAGSVASQFGLALPEGMGAMLGVAGLVAAAVVEVGKALWDCASAAAEYGDAIDKNSQKMGISAEGYQEWAYILDRNGSSIDTLKTGMKTLNKAIDEGSGAFDTLGVSLTDADGNMRSTEDIMNDTLRALAGMEDGAERTALATELFGGKVAMDLNPMLNAGADSMDELRQRAHDLGGVMSDEGVADSAAFQDAMTDLNFAMDGIKNTIGVALLPVLTTLINWFNEGIIWVNQLAANVSTGFEDMKTKVGEFAETVDQKIQEVIQWFTELPTNIANAVGDLGETLKQAGRDVIEGFKEGLREKWESAKKWFGDITSSIPKLKGPEAVDKKLLYPAGQWIIEGLQNGLESSVPSLKKTLAGITNTISGTNFNATAQLAYATSGSGGRYGQVAKNQTTNVYINGTRINDDPAIEAKFTELMYMLARKGNM